MCLINTYAVQEQFEEYYVKNPTFFMKKNLLAISFIYHMFVFHYRVNHERKW